VLEQFRAGEILKSQDLLETNEVPSMDSEYIARGSAIAARKLGGEMMIMSATDSTFFSLNEVATVIWQAADGRTPLSELVVQTVCQQFEVEAEGAIRDASEFADELSRHPILAFSNQPISGASREVAAADLETRVSPRKPYVKPGFRFERTFETTALACGKINSNQLQCGFNRKNS
jgi:Coenzyme PQQ synthesis protein D (PqqD)